jgi:hypothetical protein
MSENGDIDALAAEYVLGTLDAGERARAQSLLPADQALAAKVRIWERRLSELHLMVEPVEPDGDVWDRIKAKVQPAARAFAVPVPQPIVESPKPAVETPKSAAELLQPFAESPKPAVEEAEHKAKPVPDAATSEGVEVAKSPESSLESVDVMKSAESAERDAFARVDDSIEVARALDEAVKSIGIGRSSESVELKAATVTETPDDEPAPSGVFDDMPEPTPSGPLASFPTSFTTSAPAPAPVVPPPVSLTVPIPSPAAPPGPSLAVRPSERRKPVAAPPPSRWLSRTIATLTTLILVAVAALVAAWRFVPDRVPPPLRPVQVLRALGIATPVTVVGPAPRKPAPPESRYDE